MNVDSNGLNEVVANDKGIIIAGHVNNEKEAGNPLDGRARTDQLLTWML